MFAQVAEPIRAGEEIHAVAVTEPSPDHYIYDFGQVIDGVVRIHPPPTNDFPTYTLRYAEALDDKGMLWTGNLGTAAQTDTFVMRPGFVGLQLDEASHPTPASTWQPQFTIHGFRYV